MRGCMPPPRAAAQSWRPLARTRPRQITVDEWESIFDFYERPKPLEALIKKRRGDEALRVIQKLQEGWTKGRAGDRGKGHARRRWDRALRRATKDLATSHAAADLVAIGGGK